MPTVICVRRDYELPDAEPLVLVGAGMGAVTSPRLIASALALLAAFAAGWTGQGWRMQATLNRKELAHAQQMESLHAHALADYKHMEIIKDAAIQEAHDRAEQNRADADTARTAADSLRRDLAGVPARISTAASAAVDEYAAAATVVFEQCSAEVAELARAADGHANDARMMWEAWPVSGQ